MIPKRSQGIKPFLAFRKKKPWLNQGNQANSKAMRAMSS